MTHRIGRVAPSLPLWRVDRETEMKSIYRVQFDIAAPSGKLIHRTVNVKADSARAAVNDAWRDRGSYFDSLCDYLVDCYIAS